MKKYQRRVIKEKEKILKKLANLNRFLLSIKGKEIPREDRLLLEAQKNVMRGYYMILETRISRFKD